MVDYPDLVFTIRQVRDCPAPLLLVKIKVKLAKVEATLFSGWTEHSPIYLTSPKKPIMTGVHMSSGYECTLSI
ncbi:MAG: hypothetical protein JO297_20630 [Nitrososphaeraceae archaeon]|nr:hypothetical protein [Nitrososphaeraceae archaeon]